MDRFLEWYSNLTRAVCVPEQNRMDAYSRLLPEVQRGRVAMQEAPGLQGGGMGCRSGGKGQGLDEDRHTGLA